MRYTRFIFCLFLLQIFSLLSFGQQNPGSRPIAEEIKSSPAYAEVLLKMALLEVELDELRIRYTDEYPKVKRIRYEFEELQKAYGEIIAIDKTKASRLTLAIGKLFLQRAEYSTDLRVLRDRFEDKNIEVKRAKRRLEIFQKTIDKII